MRAASEALAAAFPECGCYSVPVPVEQGSETGNTILAAAMDPSVFEPQDALLAAARRAKVEYGLLFDGAARLERIFRLT